MIAEQRKLFYLLFFSELCDALICAMLSPACMDLLPALATEHLRAFHNLSQSLPFIGRS